MAFNSLPIIPVESISGNQFRVARLIEKSGQTFLAGTPVAIDAGTGAVIAWGGATVSGAVGSIVGICTEAASNLGSDGAGAPAPFQPYTGAGSTLTFGSVPNESSAVNIPHGAPFNDGRIGFYVATLDTVFSAPFANAGTATKPLNTDVGVVYGMTKGANNYWYVDKAKSDTVKVIGLDPRDTPATGSRVLFQFVSTTVYLLG